MEGAGTREDPRRTSTGELAVRMAARPSLAVCVTLVLLSVASAVRALHYNSAILNCRERGFSVGDWTLFTQLLWWLCDYKRLELLSEDLSVGMASRRVASALARIPLS